MKNQDVELSDDEQNVVSSKVANAQTSVLKAQEQADYYGKKTKVSLIAIAVFAFIGTAFAFTFLNGLTADLVTQNIPTWAEMSFSDKLTFILKYLLMLTGAAASGVAAFVLKKSLLEAQDPSSNMTSEQRMSAKQAWSPFVFVYVTVMGLLAYTAFAPILDPLVNLLIPVDSADASDQASQSVSYWPFIVKALLCLILGRFMLFVESAAPTLYYKRKRAALAAEKMQSRYMHIVYAAQNRVDNFGYFLDAQKALERALEHEKILKKDFVKAQVTASAARMLSEKVESLQSRKVNRPNPLYVVPSALSGHTAQDASTDTHISETKALLSELPNLAEDAIDDDFGT